MIEIKMPREREETETITVSKGCLKTRKGRFVVYDVEYLKKHIEQEAAIYGNFSAIQALKQQPCEDCISRQEALSRKHIVYDDDGIGYSVVRVDEIMALPSVTPTRPKGRWIAGADRWGYIGYKCSECNAFSIDKGNYCSNCGAEITELKLELKPN